jgi:hypothetical protein
MSALLCAGVAADTLASLSANPREALTVQSSSLPQADRPCQPDDKQLARVLEKAQRVPDVHNVRHQARGDGVAGTHGSVKTHLVGGWGKEARLRGEVPP